MNYCSPPGVLDGFHQRELNEMQSLTVHRELAVAAALDYCSEEGICPPQWVVKEAAALIRGFLKREKSTKRGRAAGLVARYQQDQWDVERLDAVEAIRRIRARTKYDYALRKSYGENAKNSRAMYHHERTLKWLRKGTFVCASMYLVGRDARVGPDAMKASFRRCNRRAGTVPFPNRYYVLNERFLLKLGFPRLTDRKPGTKFLHLYNLT